MRLVSDNVRKYTNVSGEDTTPFGRDWDVLWLGHCGSLIVEAMPSSLIYEYESRCDKAQYSGWYKRFLEDNLADGHRQVQISLVQTVCSFGFGMTKASAQKILSLLAEGANEAFDVSPDAHCRDGRLRCLVVNPQIFRHYEPPAKDGYVSPVHIGNGDGDSGDELDYEG